MILPILLGVSSAKAAGLQDLGTGSYAELPQCALAIPIASVQQSLREQILEELLSSESTVEQMEDLGLNPNQVEMETTWDLWGGEDFSTSAEDYFQVHADMVYYDSGAVRWDIGYFEVKFRLDPHQPGDENDFRCSDAVVSYPNITLTQIKYWYWGIEIRCAGEGCVFQSDQAETRRCKVQNNIQPALTSINAALQTSWELACAGESRIECDDLVTDVAASNDLRATVQAYLEDSSYVGAPMPYVGYPSAMLLRLPSWNDVYVETVNAAIVGARNDPQDELHDDVVKYGVYVRCERGVDCADRDHDGYCDDVDCCPDRFSYDNDCTDLDVDGIADACDNCEPSDCTNQGLPRAACRNADQLDFDRDGKGNVCDSDSDGDGILDLYDCDPYNPMLGLDTDQDGACERLSTGQDAQNTCSSYCVVLGDQIRDKYELLPEHWWQYLQACGARCHQASDNCADGPVTYHVPACETAHDLLISGQGPASDPAVFAECRDLFWNQDQEKRLGHLVGTRCETDVTNLTFAPERVLAPDEGGVYKSCSPDVYRVEFRTNSASLEFPEFMNDTSVESCGCEEGTPGGDWAPTCYNLLCDQTARAPWNPIRSQVFGVDENGDPNSTYPYGYTPAPGYYYPPQRATILGNEMARDRRFLFDRRLSGNHHSFDWNLRTTRTYPYPYVIPAGELPLQNPFESQFKVRVSFRTAVDPVDDPDFSEDQVKLSAATQYPQSADLCHDPDLPHIWDELWWLKESPVSVLEGWSDPNPIGWVALASGLERFLVTFDHSLGRPSAAQRFTFKPGTAVRPDLGKGPTTAGVIDSGLLGEAFGMTRAVFAYEPITDIATSAPQGRLWIGFPGAPENLWVTSEQALGVTAGQAPLLLDPQAFVDERGAALYLLGNEPPVGGGDSSFGRSGVLWKLDLQAGAWVSLGQVPALEGLSSYAAVFDPVRGEVLISGGTQDGAAVGRVLALRLEGLGVRLLAGGDPATVGRASHGIHLDAQSQRLFIAGGARDGARLDDVWSLDLRTGSWTLVSAGAPEGPGPRVRPVVRFDPRTGRLWMAGGALAEPDDRELDIRPWELDLSTGEWTVRPSLTQTASTEPGRFEGSYSADALPRYYLEIPATASLEGDVWRVDLEAESSGLTLAILDSNGARVAGDERGLRQSTAVVIGQAGERYTVQVQAVTPPGAAIPFVLRLRPASLEPVAEIDRPLDVTSVVVAGQHAYLGHATFVTAVDLSNPAAPARGAAVFTGGLVQELAVVTASTLAVVQTFSAEDLVVLDRAVPGAPARLAGLRLPGGPCRSLALRERIAYVACGSSLNLVNLGQPSAPLLLDTWHLGGLVTDVKVAGALLVVGQSSGKIRLYDLSSGSSPVQWAEQSLDGKPVQAYLSGHRLLVAEARGLGWSTCAAGLRCGFGTSTEVFSVDRSSGTLERLGELDPEGLRAPFLGFGAGVVVEPKLAGLQVYRAEVLP